MTFSIVLNTTFLRRAFTQIKSKYTSYYSYDICINKYIRFI